jgi:hypothetical protein
MTSGGGGPAIEAQIRVSGGDEIAEFASLWNELRRVHDLTGRVRTVAAAPGEEELGAAFEMLSVALGSGGMGATLAGALANWLSNRRSDISVTVKSSEREITVQAHRVSQEQAQALFEKVLKAGDER